MFIIPWYILKNYSDSHKIVLILFVRWKLNVMKLLKTWFLLVDIGQIKKYFYNKVK